MSFGYCDFSAHSHFQALSRENRYRASWTSHTYQEKLFSTSSSAKSKPNPKRMTWSPAASTSTTIKSAEVTTFSKRKSWAAAVSALNKRASWLPTSSSSTSPSYPSTSASPVPNERIPAPQTTCEDAKKKDKSRRGSVINGCIERVKSFRKKDRRDRKNYRQLDDASARINSGS